MQDDSHCRQLDALANVNDTDVSESFNVTDFGLPADSELVIWEFSDNEGNNLADEW